MPFEIAKTAIDYIMKIRTSSPACKAGTGRTSGYLQPFYRNWLDYTDYILNNFLPRKTELLRQQMEKQEEHYGLVLEQKRMLEMELEISRNGLQRYESLLEKGGVSGSQIEDARARVGGQAEVFRLAFAAGAMGGLIF